jgi:cytochrome c-type biogenesis protein
MKTNERSTENLTQSPLAKRRSPKYLLAIALFVGALLLTLLLTYGSSLSSSIESLVSTLENSYHQWLEHQDNQNPLVVIPLAFAGGMIASISPCILALLPVNLSYIGTLQITSKRDAFSKAGLFVLGAVTLFSILGLFSSLAAAIFVVYRGHVNIAVGAIIIVMGLSLVGLIRLPLPQINPSLAIAGPYGVGLTFALVTSPCASPVLISVLAIAATSGSDLLSVSTMVSYALGYTAIIFCASVFTGIVKQTRRLLQYSEWITRIGSTILIVAGMYYIVTGIRWFL